MKKVALLLGSLLMVGAVAQAADAATTFKPTGYVDLQYKIYGKTENAKNAATDWNEGNNQISRIQLLGNIAITENQSLEYRVRNYNSIAKDHGNSNKDETRLRYFYNHGNLDNTNIDFVSRVEYKRVAGSKQSLEYMPRFSFAKYMPEAVTKFVLAPRYKYQWADSNDNVYQNELGLNLETSTNLPLGFTFDFDLENTQTFYSQHKFYDGGEQAKSHNFDVAIKAIVNKDVDLYATEKTDVLFHFEGGFDKYHISQHKMYGVDKADDVVVGNRKTLGTDRASYSLYAEPTVQVTYALNGSTNLYGAVGARYENYNVTSNKSASTWRWQPIAWAGFKTTF
ncbi:FomA family porin-like outer membrane protein [Cetobacterium ceti]